ncbi:MAG: hypothetical protein WC615_15460 [Mucilaginibacter sp.]|jgi:hypothetical protein|uniref:hypothetical protein n=1 Tax=Mucilaginibacter sp. TaxID=1882438 RepID=UPI0035639111
MKRNLIYTLITGFLVLGMLSFTFIKEKPVVRKTVSKTHVAKATCTGVVNPLTASNVSWSPTSITITWSTSNSDYNHFSYGGYGVVTAGTTTSFSKTYAINGQTSRFGVVCICADGSASGSTHGVLFSPTGYSLF